jgi:hypothetical protein
MQDNPGFLILYSAFKDALVRKTGVIKWRWSDDVDRHRDAFTGLLAEQIVVIEATRRRNPRALTEGEPRSTRRGPAGVAPTASARARQGPDVRRAHPAQGPEEPLSSSSVCRPRST